MVGLAIAWELVRAGRTIALIDPAPASGATYAAAGMLAVTGEFQFGEPGAVELARAAAERYPGFVASLPSTVAGGTVGAGAYESVPTLLVGVDQADRAVLADIAAAQARAGIELEPLGSRGARRLEPNLGAAVTTAYRAAADHRVDPRALATDLLRAIGAAQPDATISAVARAIVPGPAGVEVTVEGGGSVRAGQVVVANGLAAQHLFAPPQLKSVLRPVYGDVLRLGVPAQLGRLLTATVRGSVRGRPVYLVPRRDGTVVVGASQREHGGEGVSAGAVHDLLCDARELIPAIDECRLLEATARARPAAPDHLPLIGRIAPGVVLATGTYRNGVLLAPLVAELARRALDGDLLADWPDVRPDRFGAWMPQHPAPLIDDPDTQEQP